jgi:hypothetical protein
MGERVFAQHKIPKNMIIDHIYKIYQGTLYSMANLDEEFLGEYLEADFSNRLINSLKKMRDSGFEVIYNETRLIFLLIEINTLA